MALAKAREPTGAEVVVRPPVKKVGGEDKNKPMKKENWEKNSNSLTGLGDNNYVLRGKGFYISYNPDSGRSIYGTLFDGLLNGIGTMLGEEKTGGGEETALCKDDEFYILDGDFREDYEKLVPKGFDACLKFFQKNKKHHSVFSSYKN
ncbi:hypothetical protein KY314_00255 [Candidatus Woesearchaeota archaeon]|nr:hypothetical protein [Candidatus Woesearchaeota archaeon]